MWISNSIPSIQFKWIQLSSLLELIGYFSHTEVRLRCRRTALARSLDSLYTRQPHPPPSPPPFPSLVQEGWTLEETPTGALTPPFTHTHTDFSNCPACGFVFFIPVLCVTSLYFLCFSPVVCLFAYISPNPRNPCLHIFFITIWRIIGCTLSAVFFPFNFF